MKRGAFLAAVVVFLGLWRGVAWAADKAGPGEVALNLVPGEVGEVWKPAQNGITGWEFLPSGVVEVTTQELIAIRGGGPVGVSSPGDAPGKIILWDEFRPQNNPSGLQTWNHGGGSEGAQQNLIMAVGR